VSTDAARVHVAHGSHPGLQRDQNEDRVLVDPSRGIFAVVDGVGGHPGGEHASAIAIEQLSARLARETGSPAERLREAITLANNAILDAAERDASLQGMTCVLTAALVSGARLTVGHVGDTRLYKIRQGELRKLTRDHSPVGEREDAGDLSEAEAMRHPRRNEVFRDVGAQPHAPDDTEFVEVVEETFEPDAAIVICSDGLSDQVPSAALRAIVERHAGEPVRTVEALIAAANDAGGKDNVSVVLVEGPGFAAASAAARGRAVAGAVDGNTRAGVSRRRFGGRDWLLLAAGVLLGVLASVAAAWWWHPEWFREPGSQGVPGEAVSLVAESRTWRVGLGGEADAASIGDALKLAQPGDTIRLAPGEYREAIELRQAVSLEGPADAVIRPPLGAMASWTAVTVADTPGVRLAGFTITGADGQRVAVGIRGERCELLIEGVTVTGATEAGVTLGEGARARVTTSALHDNPGAGVVVGRGAQLAMRHTSVLRNGTVAGRLRPGVRLEDGAEATLTGNAIGDNGGGSVTGWPASQLDVLVRDNLVRPLPRGQRQRPASDTPPRPASPPPSR
jgi:serine/threonine protein phosphatase PrpC